MRPELVIIQLLALLVLTAGQLSGQARVTGHVFAEVVEMSEARSYANTEFILRSDSFDAHVDLGYYTFNGGSFTMGTIVLINSTLSSGSGKRLGFSAAPSEGSSFPVLNGQGSQVVNLSGLLDRTSDSDQTGFYSGNYQIVFAYN